MKRNMWLSAVATSVMLVVTFLLSILLPNASIAQSVDVGEQTCVQDYAWYDYYSNGELTDSQYEPDGVTCFDNGGSSFTGDFGGAGGGGSGGGDEPDLTDRDIPAKLKCALDKYLHDNVKLGGRMKRVDAWAFKKQNAFGFGYDFRATNTPPGPDWEPASGNAQPGYAYGRLYKAAFQAHSNFMMTGFRASAPGNSFAGAITAFEMSLFVGAHEASHLLGNRDDENEANWYGIDALLRYRKDGGALCAGL